VDASIELPDGWVDRTVLTYVGPDAGKARRHWSSPATS